MLSRIPAFLASVSLLLAACGQSTWPTHPSLVILISFDTLRADALGVPPGGQRSLTPNLDRFARDAVVFERAFAQAPHTLISHMSLWTGVYPDVHGVISEKKSLPQAFATLSTTVKRAGYRTAAVVTSEWLKPDFGFSRGFDRYAVLPHDFTYSERVHAAALNHLDAFQESEEPLFLFLHNYEAHCDFTKEGRNKLPYYSPSRFRDDLEISADGAQYCNDEGQCAAQFLMHSGDKHFSTSFLNDIHDLYRAGVRHLDEETGKFLAELKARNLYDDALILVTADHGEEFREHGRFIHSQPYDETIAIPLLWKFPKSWKAGLRIDRVVESVDVLPTLAEYLGAEIPGYIQGESLMALIDEGEFVKKTALSQDTIQTSRYALRTQDRKVILNLKNSVRELYDLESDPGEQRNLFSGEPGQVTLLERQLIRLIRSNRKLGASMADGNADGKSLLTEKERKTLRSLGYLN